MRLPADLQRVWDKISAAPRAYWLEVVAKIVNAAAILVSFGWFVALFQVHVKMIAEPGPQEYNEPAIWHVTWLLDHGRNPYSALELPGSAMCFAPFYNYVVLAFKPLLGIDYTAHRMVNLIFLVGAIAIMVRAVCKAGAGLGIALLMAVFYYWMSLNNIELTARPDTLGLFLFLLGLLVPWEYNYSRGATLFGLACAVLAFHCKFYFAVAGCATLLGVFFVRSKISGIRLGVLFFAVIALSFLALCSAFPYLYILTVIVQRGAAALNSSDEISAMHTGMLVSRGWPFFLPLFLGLGGWLWKRHLARRAAVAGEVGRKLDAEELRVLMLGVALWIFTVLVYFYMGRNAGAYFTYHLHLLFPLMFVLGAYALKSQWARISFGVLLMVFVCWKMEVWPSVDSAVPYRRMEQLISSNQGEVLGIASQTDIFERNNRKVLHNGNTMFIGSAFGDNGIERDPMIALLARKMDEVEAEVRRKVAAREYGLVFTEFDDPYFCDKETLQRNYDMTEQIDYYTYFGHSPVRVWKPKPQVAAVK
jgi:hypothetical protein